MSEYAEAHLVEVMRHKPEGRGLDCGRTTTLGSAQPLKEMSTSSISCGKRRPVRTADNLTTFMCRLPRNL